MPGRTICWKWLGDPALVFLALLLGVAVSADVLAFREHPGEDYYIFWVYPQAASESFLTDIYSDKSASQLGLEFYQRALRARDSLQHTRAAELRIRLIPVSTPFLFACFRPIVTGRYDFDIRLFQMSSLALALAAIAFMARSLGFSVAGVLAVLIYFAWVYEPVQIDIEKGGVNRLQVAMIGLLLWALARRWPPRRRFLAAGIVLGGIVAFKPNLALVLVVLTAFALIEKRLAKAAWLAVGAVAGGVAAMAVSSLFFGSFGCWIEWVRYFPSFIGSEVTLYSTNRSLTQALREWTGLRLGNVLLGILLAASFAAAWVHRRKSPSSPSGEYGTDFAAVALGCAIPLVCGPLTWQHYLTLLFPLALYEMRPGRSANAPRPGFCDLRRVLAIAALAALTVWPAAIESFGDTHPQTVRYVFASALLVALGICDLLSRGERNLRVESWKHIV